MRNRLPIFSSNRVGKDWFGEGGMYNISAIILRARVFIVISYTFSLMSPFDFPIQQRSEKPFHKMLVSTLSSLKEEISKPLPNCTTTYRTGYSI
jgi:hypothetical protein